MLCNRWFPGMFAVLVSRKRQNRLPKLSPGATVLYGKDLYRGWRPKDPIALHKRGEIWKIWDQKAQGVLLKKLLSSELLDVSRELASEGNVVLGERWEAKSVDS